jgi:hypothetical protein
MLGISEAWAQPTGCRHGLRYAIGARRNPRWAPARQILPTANRDRNGSFMGALENVRHDQHEHDGDRHGEQDPDTEVEHECTIVRSQVAPEVSIALT